MSTPLPGKPWLHDTLESVEYLTFVAFLSTPECAVAALVEKVCDVVRAQLRDFRVGVGIFGESIPDCPTHPKAFGANRCPLSEIVRTRLLQSYPHAIRTVIIELYEGQLAPRKSSYVREVISIYYGSYRHSGFGGLNVEQQHMIVMRFRRSIFSDGNVSMVRLVERLAEVLAKVPEVFYGFADLAPAAEIAGGRAYSEIAGEWMTWHRSLEHAEWVLSPHSERMKRVRGVYWGNFLGPDMAKRLDPDGTFAARFAEHAPLPPQVVRPQRVIQYESGAKFIMLSDEPLNLLEDGFLYASSELGNAVWFKRELRDKGLV